MALNLHDQEPIVLGQDIAATSALQHPETIPGSENTLRPGFGITNPQMFAASRVERDSGLMEVDATVPAAGMRVRGNNGQVMELPPPAAPPLPMRATFEQAPTSPTQEGAPHPHADTTTPEPSYNPFNNTTLADAPDAIPSVWDNQNSDNYHRQQTPLPSVVASTARSLIGSSTFPGPGMEDEEQEEEARFSYKAHFKRAYLTGKHRCPAGRIHWLTSFRQNPTGYAAASCFLRTPHPTTGS